MCDNCIVVRKILRRLCRNRFLYNNKPLHKFTNTSQIVKSTPTKAMEKIETIGDHLHLVQKSKRYYRMIFEEQREKDGISIDINKCGILFDKEADAEAEKIFNSRGETNADKDLLSRLLWNQSLQATVDAKLKGKKQVRYHPIMIRFAVMLRSKMNKGTYAFVAGIFNLPSSRSVAYYDSVDGSAKDGILFDAVRLLQKRLRDTMKEGKTKGMADCRVEWMRMGSLSFDSMSIMAKVKFDPHSNELVGFQEGALKEDVVMRELDEFDKQQSSSSNTDSARKSIRPDLSQQFLVFIFSSWDADSPEMKSVVARYATGSGIRAEYLVPKIRYIIASLYAYGFIVNNICGDGATENRSAFKQLGTMTVADIFPHRCQTCSFKGQSILKKSLLDNHPNDKLPIAFQHPCDSTFIVFIGGEMPHWVKKVVNRLEGSSTQTSKVNLMFRGQSLSLNMIKKVWLWDDEGFSTNMKTVLTENHFYKNACSCMRVHLAVQVLSASVVNLKN